MGLYHYAHSYAACAKALSQTHVSATHSDAPVRFLYRHAVELYLKAYLRSRGVTTQTLRSRQYGHSTIRLVGEAIALGFEITDRDRRMVEALDDSLADRYLVTGTRRVLSPAQMLLLCQRLHVEVGFPIYAAAGLKRRLPDL